MALAMAARCRWWAKKVSVESAENKSWRCGKRTNEWTTVKWWKKSKNFPFIVPTFFINNSFVLLCFSFIPPLFVVVVESHFMLAQCRHHFSRLLTLFLLFFYCSFVHSFLSWAPRCSPSHVGGGWDETAAAAERHYFCEIYKFTTWEFVLKMEETSRRFSFSSLLVWHFEIEKFLIYDWKFQTHSQHIQTVFRERKAMKLQEKISNLLLLSKMLLPHKSLDSHPTNGRPTISKTDPKINSLSSTVSGLQ